MSRTRKTFAAYVPAGCEMQGAEVLFETSSDNYDYAGMILPLDGSGQWRVTSMGWSAESVARRTGTEARKVLGPNYSADWAVRRYSGTSIAWEVTAPVIEKYFGHHRLTVTAVFRANTGWENVNWKAGKSLLRRLAKEGVIAIAVTGRGNEWSEKELAGTHVADFQMTEVVKSMNARRTA